MKPIEQQDAKFGVYPLKITACDAGAMWIYYQLTTKFDNLHP